MSCHFTHILDIAIMNLKNAENYLWTLPPFRVMSIYIDEKIYCITIHPTMGTHEAEITVSVSLFNI